VPRLILASHSPRRAALLQQLGLEFTVAPAAIDEQPHPDEPADSYVLRMAREKNRAARHHLSTNAAPPTTAAIVLTADTAVVAAGQILGKPADFAAGKSMLERLSGRTHQVLTAVTIAAQNGTEKSALSRSRVRFAPLTEPEIVAYWQTGEPHDKAGGYAIQGQGARFVVRLAGSYSGVVGLPLHETAALLAEFGID